MLRSVFILSTTSQNAENSSQDTPIPTPFSFKNQKFHWQISITCYKCFIPVQQIFQQSLTIHFNSQYLFKLSMNALALKIQFL